MSVMGSRRPTGQVTAPAGDDGRSDAALAAAAAIGDRRAFETLYRRHAAAAWRVASAVAANPDDAADAVSDAFTRVLTALEAGRLKDSARFRSYLLSATRNAAVDLHRRTGRLRPTDRLDQLDTPSRTRSATERVDDRQDATFVAEAFRGLPERWRSVLWLTEVEGIPAREAATLLGLSANNVAQLALRARAGLRERYVQAHLRAPVDPDCRFCVERLGGYVMGTLAPRDLAKVDQHLAGCAPCRGRAAELDDLRTSLRRIVVPLPLLLGTVMAKWQLTASAAPAAPAVLTAPGTGATGVGGRRASTRLHDAGAQAQKPLLAASTALFALGIIGASVVGGRDALRPPLLDPPPVDAAGAVAPPSQVVADRVVLAVATGLADAAASDVTAAGQDDGLAPSPAGAVTSAPPGDAGPPTAVDPGGDDDTGGGGPPPASPEPLANVAVGARIAGQPMAVSAGSGDGSCTGVATSSSGSSCATAPAPGPVAAATVATDGTIAGGALNDRTIAVSL